MNQDEEERIIPEKRKRTKRRGARTDSNASQIGLDSSVLDSSILETSVLELPSPIEASAPQMMMEEVTEEPLALSPILPQQKEEPQETEDVSVSKKLLSVEAMYKEITKKIESSIVRDSVSTNQSETVTEDDNEKFVLRLTENQIKLRIEIAKEKGLTQLPDALIKKISQIFTIAIPYLWKVEEKQRFLLDAFGSSYSSALSTLLKMFYIPLEDDPLIKGHRGFKFLVPEEVDDYEEKDRLREEQQQVITAMTNTNISKDAKDDVDKTLLELFEKHNNRYKYRQNRFLSGLADPKNFLKEADLFREQRIQKAEAQRKQRQVMLERKKLAHSTTIKPELQNNRFTAGIKVKSKKKRK